MDPPACAHVNRAGRGETLIPFTGSPLKTPTSSLDDGNHRTVLFSSCSPEVDFPPIVSTGNKDYDYFLGIVGGTAPLLGGSFRRVTHLERVKKYGRGTLQVAWEKKKLVGVCLASTYVFVKVGEEMKLRDFEKEHGFRYPQGREKEANEGKLEKKDTNTDKSAGKLEARKQKRQSAKREKKQFTGRIWH